MEKEFLAKGKRGIVYRAVIGRKTVAVKKENPDSNAINRINNEANFLKEANKLGIGPKYISHTEKELVMEMIEGRRIEEFVKEGKKKEIINVLKEVLEQCFRLDEAKISKKEMNHPYKHIIVSKRGPVMIDFERARRTMKPGNVTQFCQYVCSSGFSSKLREKGITIDKNSMIRLAKIYSEEISKKNLKEIIYLIR